MIRKHWMVLRPVVMTLVAAAGMAGMLAAAAEEAGESSEGSDALSPPPPISISFDETPLHDVVKQLAEALTINVSIGEDVGNEPVTFIASYPMPRDLVFDLLIALLDTRGYVLLPEAGGAMYAVERKEDLEGSDAPVAVGEGDPAKQGASAKPSTLFGIHAPAGEPVRLVAMRKVDIMLGVLPKVEEMRENVKAEVLRDDAGEVVGVTATGIGGYDIVQQLGLKDGDVITAVNGISLASEEALEQVGAQLQAMPPMVAATLERDGERPHVLLRLD